MGPSASYPPGSPLTAVIAHCHSTQDSPTLDSCMHSWKHGHRAVSVQRETFDQWRKKPRNIMLSPFALWMDNSEKPCCSSSESPGRTCLQFHSDDQFDRKHGLILLFFPVSLYLFSHSMLWIPFSFKKKKRFYLRKRENQRERIL